MKMSTGNVDTIERIGVGADREFTIDFSAKMASILADGLYSDKIQSVVRELCCNAYDSHVAAGHPDRPIKVHFPNRFEPFFYVEDFGIGLSHNEVMGIYTKYGASTKTNSNDFIGALGLGSKSPFALTDSFTVTARKDGIENHYSMYRNEKGMPSVAHLGSSQTIESNGVKVTVPVHTDQRNEFIEKSKAVFKWFPVKPITVGDTITYDKIEYQYQGNGWGIIKVDYRTYNYGYRNSQRPVALMGLVAYPLDTKSIKGLSNGAKALLETPVVLTFGIGDLEIAANREALGYDERTCAAIVNRMNTMIADLGAEFEKQIAEADTLWNAKKKFGEIFKNDHRFQFNDAFSNLGLKWNGHVIKENYQNIVPSQLYGLNSNDYADCKIQHFTYRYKRGRSFSFTDKEPLSIPCDEKTVIIYNDLKLGGLSRISEYNKKAGENNNVYVFHPHDTVSFDTLKNALGNPEIILTSSLPKPVRKTSERTGVYLFRTDVSHTGGAKDWKSVDIDLDDGGYYVDLNGWQHVWNGKEEESIGWWRACATELNIIQFNTPIYAMRSKNKKLVSEHPEWTNLIDKIKEHIEMILTTRNLGQEISHAREYDRLVNWSNWEFWKSMYGIKDENSPMAKFIETANQYRGYRNDIYTIQSIVSKFEITVEPTANVVDLVKEHDKLMTRYPMLKFMKNMYKPTSEQIRDSINYVNFVDTAVVFVSLQDTEETP